MWPKEFHTFLEKFFFKVRLEGFMSRLVISSGGKHCHKAVNLSLDNSDDEMVFQEYFVVYWHSTKELTVNGVAIVIHPQIYFHSMVIQNFLCKLFFGKKAK